MPRGYRRYIFAAFGWLILVGAGPAPDGKTQSKDAAAKSEAAQQLSRIAAALEKPSEPPSPDAGCANGEDNRQSDLCAQWKAADAAHNAARWSWWQLVIGGVGLILGGVTMGAAIAAAIYAKRAAIATEKTVEIAQEASEGAAAALDIAERNAKAAMVSAEAARLSAEAYMSTERARLVIEGVGGSTCEGGRMIDVSLRAANIGRSAGFIEETKWLAMDDVVFIDDYSASHQFQEIIPPNAREGIRTIRVPIGTKFIGGSVRYRTGFGPDNISYFIFRLVPHDKASGLIIVGPFDHHCEYQQGINWPKDT